MGYDVEITFKDDIVIPYFPTNTKYGLLYPKKIPRSGRWGYEIKYAIARKDIKEVKFFGKHMYSARKIFSSFINYFYQKRLKKKQEKRTDLAQFYKLIMNSLYGKFSQSQYPKITFCETGNLRFFLNSINMEKYRYSREGKYFFNQKYKTSMDRFQDEGNCDIKNIRNIGDDIWRIEYQADNESINFLGTFVRFASFTTMMSRISLMKGVHNVGEENVFYMDTDSIFTDRNLSQSMIDQERLGAWKKEGEFKSGHFIAPKLYYLETEDTKIKAAKGIKSKDQLNIEEVGKIMENQKVEFKNENIFQKKGRGRNHCPRSNKNYPNFKTEKNHQPKLNKRL